MSEMNEEASEEALLVVAIAAVLLEESGGSSIGPSAGRRVGTFWSNDHRRMSVGKTSLVGSRPNRSAKR